MTASHFLSITDGQDDISPVHGVYDSFEAARDDTDRRILADDPGEPFGGYLRIAHIEEWTGRVMGREWSRYGSPPGSPPTWHEH